MTRFAADAFAAAQIETLDAVGCSLSDTGNHSGIHPAAPKLETWQADFSEICGKRTVFRVLSCLLKNPPICSIIPCIGTLNAGNHAAEGRGLYEREKTYFTYSGTAGYTVVLSGAGLMAESGYPLLRDGEESYEIEDKYGYSFEEIFSSGFYSARKELFFRFYKEVILKAVDIPPGKGFSMLKKLQDHGLVDSIITRRIAGLEDRADAGMW